MKELKTLNDDPEVRQAAQALAQCQDELLKVTARIADVELEIFNAKPPRHDHE